MIFLCKIVIAVKKNSSFLMLRSVFLRTKSAPISAFGLRGVGPQTAKNLAKLQIFSVQDLLFHLPARYQDRSKIMPIRTVTVGDEAVVDGVITSISTPPRGKTKLLCTLRDATGTMQLRFFHLLNYQKTTLKIGSRLQCFGEVRLGNLGLEMSHPEFKILSDDDVAATETTLTPIYPATEGLSQHMLRKLTAGALQWLDQQAAMRELLPLHSLSSLTLPSLKDALRYVHRPPVDVSMYALAEHQTPSQKRLVIEELIAHRLSLLQLKKQFQSAIAPAISSTQQLTSLFLQQLPFQLTNAQARVAAEISHDLSQQHPMLRLVQGDVGSGKTVIAALAMLQAIEHGYQTVMMAPTELLAEQHYRVFEKWLAPLNIPIAFLSGNIKGAARNEVLQEIQSGKAKVILGTHALFQDKVIFDNLSLVIIDEQHRFGVQQRAMLRQKAMQLDRHPHQLIMTATPIPRTLSMSLYADLDCSIIDELPPGRTPIMTSVLANARRDDITARIHEACLQGKQAYWVCPLIEESESLNCQSAVKAFEELQAQLSDLKVGLIHGRLSASEKEQAMRAFQQGETHLLVATTVIEVGVDVPNASLMIIENAERLGLSQLHQLRGRVGRGTVASHCILLYQYPLSKLARERLAVMRDTTDGFKIAQRDLELRGPGEVLGTRQTGDLTFRVADLMRDGTLFSAVQQIADEVLNHHPELIEPLMRRWLKEAATYGKV